MKKHDIFLSVLAVTAAILIWPKQHNAPPADLRDALASGGAYDALQDRKTAPNALPIAIPEVKIDKGAGAGTLPLNLTPQDLANLQLTPENLAFVNKAIKGQFPGYGVHYSLNGQLTGDAKAASFKVDDGRVFKRMFGKLSAEGLFGRQVHIEAAATQADRLDFLRVLSAEVYDPAVHSPALPPYQPVSRPVQLVSAGTDGIAMKNVRWHRDLRTAGTEFDWAAAKIRPELLKEMYFIKKPFEPEWIAAHSMYLFKFAKGGVTDTSGREISNLLLSIEGYLREGQEYSLEAGVKSQLDIVWLLATWEDYLGRVVKNKERMIPYRMKLKPEAMRQLLVESLRQAAVNRAGEKYHLVTNNCTNNLVILLNRVLPRENKISLWTNKGYDLKTTLPNAVPEYLTKLGYLEAPMPQLDAASYLPGTDWPGGYPAANKRQ